MSFALPAVLLLLLPLVALLWRTGRLEGPAMPLRLGLVTLLVLALAQPQLDLDAGGSDVVFLVDRSRSMPRGVQASAEELIGLAASQRGPKDRLGVISFAREARVDMNLSATAAFAGFGAAIDDSASNLATGLDAVSDLIPLERKGRVIVVSDGKATGLDVKAAARRLAARGIHVDYRWAGREDANVDVAVTGLELPSQVASNEPFQLTATLTSISATNATVTLLRNGQPIAKTQRALTAGPNVLTFRDLLETPGLAAYQLRVEAAGDSTQENDFGRGVLRVEGPPRVLLLTDKPTGTMAKALTAANVNLTVRAPGALDLAQLEGVSAVVLEDVEAGRLTENGLHTLASYVREAGGGLVMTGGHHSFGEGGYRKSPVEDLLPVSLEVREEQRKAPVAISIVMDCSCSMGAPIADGRTKMELAAEGVVGALQLLDQRDEAAVTMVDTEPHEIFGMRPVSEGLPLDKVARGFSGGGGILIGVGMHVAKDTIFKSSRPTRHVLLFADASDSVQPDDYHDTISKLVNDKVTISVIGMGSPADKDAALLREIAALGSGRVYFAEDVTSLPRIFSQETIAVARSTFVEEPTAAVLGPDLSLLGKLTVSGGTRVDGYNLTYLRPQANVGLRSDDANKAPLLAFWPRGAGKVAALTLEADGKFTGAFRTWSAQREVLEQTVRWVMPPTGQQGDALARASLSGNTAHVTLDFDPKDAPPGGTPTLVMLPGDGRSKPIELPMRWEDSDRLAADFQLPTEGTWHPVIKVGARVFRAAPMTLPWASEFEPRPAREGKELLAAMAKAGMGVERLAIVNLFADTTQSRTGVALAPWLVGLCVMLLVVEVFVRRFFSGRVKKVKAAVKAPVPSQPTVPVAARISAPRPGPAPTPAAPPVESPAPEAPKSPDVKDALTAAREAAKRRTGRS